MELQGDEKGMFGGLDREGVRVSQARRGLG